MLVAKSDRLRGAWQALSADGLTRMNNNGNERDKTIA
jgi:hypothetical protein